MSIRPGRRACAVIVVLALLAGAATGGARGAGGCGECPAGCPMHVRRPTCHRTSTPRCHQAGKLPGLRPACGHVDRATPAEALRAVMPPRGLPLQRATVAHRVRPRTLPVSRPGPEPISPPPRAVRV